MDKLMANGSKRLVDDLAHQVLVREKQSQRQRGRWPDCKFDFSSFHSEVLWGRYMVSKTEGPEVCKEQKPGSVRIQKMQVGRHTGHSKPQKVAAPNIVVSPAKTTKVFQRKGKPQICP